MRRIIRNKVYDTDKAKQIGREISKVDAIEGAVFEKLYKKHSGEYFRSMFSLGSRKITIVPIEYSEAQAWARDHMPVTEYMRAFEAPEAGVKISTCIEIDGRIMFEVRRAAAIAGETLAEWITEAIEVRLEGEA